MEKLYRLEEVAKADSGAQTSPGNPCSRPAARPSPEQDPDESWDFWAERRPEGQFHPREPSRDVMFRADFTLALYSLANLFGRFWLWYTARTRVLLFTYSLNNCLQFVILWTRTQDRSLLDVKIRDQ